MEIEEYYGINNLNEFRPIVQQALWTVFEMAQGGCTESEQVQALSKGLLEEAGFLDADGEPIRRNGE